MGSTNEVQTQSRVEKETSVKDFEMYDVALHENKGEANEHRERKNSIDDTGKEKGMEKETDQLKESDSLEIQVFERSAKNENPINWDGLVEDVFKKEIVQMVEDMRKKEGANKM